VAYAEVTGALLCLLSIDFKEDFDNISHYYLSEILRKYSFSEHFQRRIRNIYSNAISVIQANNFRSKPVSTKSSVRQGCPMNMLLYSTCFNPLLSILDKHLTGLCIGRGCARTSVIGYADDIKILVTAAPSTRK
jgi:hypothetical protein